MIHRKWSLLTGPAAILGGIVGTVVVANFVFLQNEFLDLDEIRVSKSQSKGRGVFGFEGCDGRILRDPKEAPISTINIYQKQTTHDPFLKPERKLEKAPSTK